MSMGLEEETYGIPALMLMTPAGITGHVHESGTACERPSVLETLRLQMVGITRGVS